MAASPERLSHADGNATDVRFVMSAGTSHQQLHEEAGTDEVTALAALIARPAHIPAPREDEDDVLSIDRVEVPADEPHLLPRQPDEFTCRSCFLVTHESRRSSPGSEVCGDCV
jgi:hypothetical protein